MDRQSLVGIPAAYQRAQEDLVSYRCRWGIETWVGPVGSEIEIAVLVTEVVALLVTEVAVLLVTEVVVLLVTGVVVPVPSVVPLGGEGPRGRVGPSEVPSGALVQVPELRVRAGGVDRKEGP